jgi:diguanylate cyclase (GGDEF)-like protein
MFFDLADQEFSRSHRYKHPLSIIMMDIDRFKLVNDTYGHAAGDIVLTQVAQMCRESLRLVDILARYGGEEFVVMLPETTAAEAQLIAERMRLLIARTAILSEQNSVHITLSFGVVELDPTCKNIEELLNRSDQAMYIAKRKGRNRVSVWSPGLQPH